jgi:hypothetical protein
MTSHALRKEGADWKEQDRYSESSGGSEAPVRTSNFREIHHGTMDLQVLPVKQMRPGMLSFRLLIQYREG